jgi:hypothetical protein
MDMKSRRSSQQNTPGISSQNLSKLSFKTGFTANNWALERPLSAVGVGPMSQMGIVGMGGKRRHKYRKTQKKRKQGRKTRKGRGKK